IDRRESGTDTWERIATPSANATAYTDSGLLSGTLYYYKAKAYNATGDSAYTAVAAATTPSMSGLVIISARFGKAGAWLDVTDGMREKTVDGCLYYHVADAFVDFGDPAPGAEKVLELQYQLDGQAATSTTAEGEIILINPPPPVPVCRAKLLSATYGVEGVAMVDCTEDLRNFIMGNKLYFNTFSANSVFGDPVPGASKTLVLDYYDQDNVRRTLRSPEEGAGSKFTLVFSETPIGPPATPGNPVASALDAGRIRLTWADSSDNETGFKIDRRQSGTDPWVRVAEPAANATAYTDNGLPAGTKFYYKVKAWNAAGDSAYTAVAFATTETGQPPSEWVAYNDLAWSAGQPTVNITTYTTTNGFAAGVNMGPLVDHSTGQETGVQLLITGGDGMAGSQGAHPASGTDAHEVFDGKVNCVGTISYGSQDLSLTFTGLDPALRYQLVLYADRNGAGYVGASARGHYGTLLGAQSFKNQSTAGALIVTDAGNHQPDDTTLYNAGYNGASGLVTRFTQIEPGTDGRIVLRLKQGGAAEYEHYFARCYTYANAVALMVQDSFLPAAEDADADAIADAWEASHFGSTSVLDAGSAQDSDGDGLRDVDEYITGTDPTNTASCFAVQVGLSAGNVVVSFPTVQATGAGYANVTRHYTLESSSGTGDTAAWQAVAGYANLPATGETVVYTNAGADSVLVYRARVWLESLE
ncbi:MAG: hypothetical protein JXR37_28300, partial [Kiritimatiellae bacterium]|nr:hypothetical protein [Kiritimatiellia bacterium]